MSHLAGYLWRGMKLFCCWGLGIRQASPFACTQIHGFSLGLMAPQKPQLSGSWLVVLTHGSTEQALQKHEVLCLLLWHVSQELDDKSSFWHVCLSTSQFSAGSVSQDWSASKWWRFRNRILSAPQAYKKSAENWFRELNSSFKQSLFTVSFPLLLLLLLLIFCRKLIWKIGNTRW